MKKTLLVIFCIVCAGNIRAAGPAVSGLNSKLDASAGWIDGDGTVHFGGSMTFPVGNAFGLQIDGLYGWADDESIYGLGGHFFWRNPEYALLGLTAGIGEYDRYTLRRFGGEGAIYWNRITIGGELGYQGGDLGDDGYGGVDLGYYFGRQEDTLVMLTYGHFDEYNFLAGEAEVQTGPGGLSFFANGALGENSYEHLLVGIRYYFGGRKSLKKRHREDDPPNMVRSFMTESLQAVREH